MRIFYTLLVTAGMAIPVVAQPPIDSSSRCFETLLQKIPDDCPLTVIMNDSSRMRCTLPIVLRTPSALYLRPIVGKDIGSSVFVPFSRINSITYAKPSPMRYGVVLLGLGAGAWAGAAIGVASAPESKGFLDFPQIPCGIIGGIIGGLVGAALGDQLSKGLKTTVIIRCP